MDKSNINPLGKYSKRGPIVSCFELGKLYFENMRLISLYYILSNFISL